MDPSIIYMALPFLITLGLIRKYREYTWGKFNSKVSLSGKVCIVTGANSGIGKETVRGLVERNAKVIMACRDIKSAMKAVADIRRTTKNGEVIPLYVDLQSIDSIKIFANIILQDFPEIHLLVNNAGLSVPLSDNCVTDDDFELHFGVNYLGHFILTSLLLDRLKKSAPSRIVIVSSSLHEYGVIDFDNLNGEKGWNKTVARNSAYCNSKLQNIYFTHELSEMLKGTGVTVYAALPGLCKTNLMRYSSLKWYYWIAFIPIAFFYLRTAKQGSQTVLYCAAAEELGDQTGLIYRNCKPYQSKHQIDPEVSARLWKTTDEMIRNTGKL